MYHFGTFLVRMTPGSLLNLLKCHLDPVSDVSPLTSSFSPSVVCDWKKQREISWMKTKKLYFSFKCAFQHQETSAEHFGSLFSRNTNLCKRLLSYVQKRLIHWKLGSFSGIPGQKGVAAWLFAGWAVRVPPCWPPEPCFQGPGPPFPPSLPHLILQLNARSSDLKAGAGVSKKGEGPAATHVRHHAAGPRHYSHLGLWTKRKNM